MSLVRRTTSQPGDVTAAPVDNNKLYFLHIPKTAGTSLRYWLWDAFDESDYLECYTLDDLAQTDPACLDQARLFSGHFGLALWGTLRQRPRTITFLREPLAHALSGLRHLHDGSHSTAATKQPSMEWLDGAMTRLTPQEILRDPAYRVYFANIQVRHLSGGPVDGSPYEVDEAAYDRARRTLESIEAFGLVERLEESLILVEEKFGWPPRQLRYRLNTSSAPAEDPLSASLPVLADEFYAANKWDLRLYEFARTLFEHRLVELRGKLGLPGPHVGSCIDGSIDGLRAALGNKILNTPPLIPAIGAGRYPASFGIMGDGWDERTSWPPVGRWLRWAGRCERHSILLPLAKQQRPLIARLEIFYIASDAIRDALAITVDDAIAEFKRIDVRQADGVFYNTYEVLIPLLASSEAANWRTLDLVVPHRSLAALGNASDSEPPQRPFALGDIELVPIYDA